MAEKSIEPELKAFIDRYVPSVEHLEILMLLSAAPETQWTADVVNQTLRSSEASVAARLMELAGQGFLEKLPIGESAFRYRPANEMLANAVEALRSAYKERRVRVIEAIYAPRVEPVREFSEAFKFRK